MGQEQPLFCFDDYTSPFISVKEEDVIRGPSPTERKRVLVVFLFCVPVLFRESGLMWQVLNRVQQMSGVFEKELYKASVYRAFIQSPVHTFPKGFTCPHLNIQM